MDKDINKNLTPTQEQGIANQDVTQKGVIDLGVVEAPTQDIPEQPVPAPIQTVSVAEQFAKTRAEQKAKAEAQRLEADKLAQEQSGQETLVRTLAGETIGQGAAETQAIADAGINSAQAEIDALDEAILASSTALKQAQVQDERDVQALAGTGRGIPAQVVRGKQQLLAQQRLADRKVQAIELENDIATSELLQGKTDNAKKAIQRAVALKFEDKKQELALEREFLSRIDSKESKARSEAIRREEKQIAQIEKQAEDVFSIAEDARKNGAGKDEVNAILNSQNRDEALSNARSIGASALLDMQLKRLNIQSKSLSIKEQKKKLEALTDEDNGITIKPDFQAATFAKRMLDANEILKGTERGVGEKIGTIASLGLANREERQKRNQAERNFVNALLRQESGAAISPEEFESARDQYFAKSTDTEAVRKQKAENRRVVFEGMRVSSGDAYDYLNEQIDSGSPDSLLDSFNLEESSSDFLKDL